MAKVRKKQYTDQNVLDAALERIRYIYSMFDHVCVSFSGGKDSTAVLNLCIQVATELGRLPVRAIFFDEEAIHPPTIEYVERTAARGDVALEWYCLPVKHRNACSNEQPFWFCWNPEEQNLWVRPMPPAAITTHPRFEFGESFQDFCYKLLRRNEVILMGIRTQESLRRYRIIANKKNDSFLSKNTDNGTYAGYPIYDWSSEDVWRLVKHLDLDYNGTYDTFNRTRFYNNLLRQRVCPPYGEEPLRGLWVYAECFPAMWHKMLYRVKGVATAWRYANTELYSNTGKPAQLTWAAYAALVLESYVEVKYRDMVKENMEKAIQEHRNKTDNDIPEEDAHPLSGVSWRLLAKIAVKGDFKGRQRNTLIQLSEERRLKLGITLEEAQKLHGKKK